MCVAHRIFFQKMSTIRILTLPFDPVTEGFPDEIVREFCANKGLVYFGIKSPKGIKTLA